MAGRRALVTAAVLPAAAAVLLGGCAATTAQLTAHAPAGAVSVLRPTVLAEIPHDPAAFTQGLEISGDALYEGTGLEGSSQLRELDPATGAVRRSAPVPDDMFGEGITVVDDRVWQLTWQSGVAVEWDRATFTVRREVPVDGEGWGLCRDGDRLVRSDGTDRLRFHDPATFAETGAVPVTREGAPLTRLNELECVDGRVWANVWQTDEIVRIDPATGVVDVVVDASGLLDEQRRQGADVLNGIAHAGGDEYLLTGKWWPVTFRVRLDPPR
jgi:glutamine cyclotransferase